MVCPNCKSNDIVAIQGQNYCINCGQRVDSPAVVPVEPVKAVGVGIKLAETAMPKPNPKIAAVTQKAPQIKIRTKSKLPPAAPKSSLIINHPTVSTPKITVASSSKSEAVARIPARSSSKAAPLDLRSDQRKEVLETRRSMLAKPGKAPTRLSDVRRAKPATAPLKPPAVSAGVAPTSPKLKSDVSKPELSPLPAAKITEAEAVDSKPAIGKYAGEGSALVYAWKQLGNWRYVLVALASSAIAVVPSLIWRLNVDTVSFYQSVVDGPNKLIGTSVLADVARIGAVWIAGMAIAYLVHVITANAITYSMAREVDGHGSKSSTWLKAGLRSLLGVIAIDLILIPLWALLVSAEVYLLAIVAYGNLPQLQQLGILVAAHSVLVYAVLALIFIRILGGYAVVIGGLSTRSAIGLGWKLYRKRSLALAVCGVIGAVVSGVIYLPAMALNFANRDLSAEVSGLGQLLGAAGFTAVLASFTLVFVTAYFFKHYRRSVLAVLGRSNPKLLTARQTQPLKAKSKGLLGGLTVTLVGLGLAGLLNSQVTIPWLEQLIRLVNP